MMITTTITIAMTITIPWVKITITIAKTMPMRIIDNSDGGDTMVCDNGNDHNNTIALTISMPITVMMTIMTYQ